MSGGLIRSTTHGWPKFQPCGQIRSTCKVAQSGLPARLSNQEYQPYGQIRSTSHVVKSGVPVMWPNQEYRSYGPIMSTSQMIRSGPPDLWSNQDHQPCCPIRSTSQLSWVTEPSHDYSYVPTKSSSHAGELAGTNQVSAGEPPRGKIQNTCSFLKAETAGKYRVEFN